VYRVCVNVLIGKVKFKSVTNCGLTASFRTVCPAGKMPFVLGFALATVDVSFQML